LDDLVFVAIVAARFGVPLLIPRFPLPAIAAAFTLDAVDQTVFAAFDVEPPNYQSYDKALDIYYLAIAYISTIRNWTDGFAFGVAQFLWYYRLVGVLAFEFSGVRALLLIFPNTFEYFFDTYEAVRVWYDPRRLVKRAVLGIAAFIWIFIKLPQEWWIHVAQLDFTDFLGENLWLLPVFAVVGVGGAALIWFNRERIPKTDWPPTVDVDARGTSVLGRPADPVTGPWALIGHPLIEKLGLIVLVSLIFGQMLPDVNASDLELAIAIAIVIVLNSFATEWLVGRGTSWANTTSQFLAMYAINIAIVFGSWLLLRESGGDLHLGNTLFFITLLTLIVTLYDRYRAMRMLGPVVTV
jgi:hypothetical protein